MFKKIFLVLFCLSSTNTFAFGHGFRSSMGMHLSGRAMSGNHPNVIIIDNTLFNNKDDKKAITGKAEVYDGDTFKINDKKIRLVGIDTPELSQNCKRRKLVEPCGKIIKEIVELIVKNKDVTCYNYGIDLYGHILGECYVDDLNINKLLLREGLAVYYYNENFKDYKTLENLAKEEKNGIWATRFVIPKDYRKQ